MYFGDMPGQVGDTTRQSADVEIDDSLYSRQRYVLGDDAMKKLAKAKVLIVNVGGVGVEIAKNVILAGPKIVHIVDSNLAAVSDMATQFYVQAQDIADGLTRAGASMSKLCSLNPNVKTCEVQGNVVQLIQENSYHCVVLTEIHDSNEIVKINTVCRERNVKFILADNVGLMGTVFCDFGCHTVTDPTGEQKVDIVIANISKELRGVVETVPDEPHGLDDGDCIIFKGVEGMTQLNGSIHKVTVIDRHKLKIGDTSHMNSFVAGMFQHVHQTQTVEHVSFEEQLRNPSLLFCDLKHFEREAVLHVVYRALLEFQVLYDRKPSSENDWTHFFRPIVDKVCQQCHLTQISEADMEIVRIVAMSSGFNFAPLCSVIGGVSAQEVLKSLTTKFTPLKQFLHLEYSELYGDDVVIENGSRYSNLIGCVGKTVTKDIANLHIFMVGCGAIGCELLKIFALLGAGTGSHSQVCVTDNDMIEKSNLNRQFLFRPEHVKQAKSTVAADTVKMINQDMKIVAMHQRVGPETENSHFNDGFISQNDVIVNALDNIDARIYVDSRCVRCDRPLLESGTSGSKGHVQVIVPFLTESYASQRDPVTNDVPFCTLKTFPLRPEHVIIWSKNKFASLFTEKPSYYEKFWPKYQDMKSVVKSLKDESVHAEERLAEICSVILRIPKNWEACVLQGRAKFEKYFCEKARKMLRLFPEDHLDEDGSPFWKPPKRPPRPILFDEHNVDHASFVLSYAVLNANLFGVQVPAEPAFTVLPILKNYGYFKESFITSVQELIGDDVFQTRLADLIEMEIDGKAPTVQPITFDKDVDVDIDFITSASSLRAQMYGMEPCDRWEVKRVAGRIVPAIATTTATVAGLVALQLIRLVQLKKEKKGVEMFRNTFLDLAQPSILYSEPAPPPTFRIVDDHYRSIWDKTEVQGCDDFTLEQFLTQIETHYSGSITMVAQGDKSVYLRFIPQHKLRKQSRMVDLVEYSEGASYIYLLVCFEDDTDIAGTDDGESGTINVKYMLH